MHWFSFVAKWFNGTYRCRFSRRYQSRTSPGGVWGRNRKDAKTHNLGLDPLGISLRLCASAVQCNGSHSSRSASMGRVDAAFRDGIKVEHRRGGLGEKPQRRKDAKTHNPGLDPLGIPLRLCASAVQCIGSHSSRSGSMGRVAAAFRDGIKVEHRRGGLGEKPQRRKDAKTHNPGLDPLGIPLRLCASAVQCIGSHSSRSASMGRIDAAFRDGIKVEHRREGFGGETAKTQRHITSGWIHLEFLCASAPLRFNALVLIRREVLQWDV
jgi:hypothetical protein